MVTPSGSTKPETGRGSCRLRSAASSMAGSAAIDVVVENATIIEGKATRRKRNGPRRASSQTLGK